MKIFVEKENKEIEFDVKEKMKLKEVLKELKVNPESVILVKNNEVCLEDVMVCNEDKIKLLSVVSGG